MVDMTKPKLTIWHGDDAGCVVGAVRSGTNSEFRLRLLRAIRTGLDVRIVDATRVGER
ncbi:MAG: hypothetical protein ACRDS1_06760 [Pseudonocardiaceae bacterium]